MCTEHKVFSGILTAAVASIGIWILICIAAMMLSGCENYGMTNDAIVRESIKCTGAGFNAVPLKNSDGAIYHIQCQPKDPKKGSK